MSELISAMAAAFLSSAAVIAAAALSLAAVIIFILIAEITKHRNKQAAIRRIRNKYFSREFREFNDD